MTLIVTTSPGFGKHGRVPEALAKLGWSLVRCDTDAEVAQQIADADFLVAGLLHVDAATLAAGARLKGVLKHGVGKGFGILGLGSTGRCPAAKGAPLAWR